MLLITVLPFSKQKQKSHTLQTIAKKSHMDNSIKVTLFNLIAITNVSPGYVIIIILMKHFTQFLGMMTSKKINLYFLSCNMTKFVETTFHVTIIIYGQLV